MQVNGDGSSTDSIIYFDSSDDAQTVKMFQKQIRGSITNADSMQDYMRSPRSQKLYEGIFPKKKRKEQEASVSTQIHELSEIQSIDNSLISFPTTKTSSLVGSK